MLELEKPVLVYVPAYNCREFVMDTLRKIPAAMAPHIECLVVDNCSPDRTGEHVAEEIAGGFPFRITVIRTDRNVGYAGSQKLAYHLACEAPVVRKVIMLHGDGQYPAELLTQYLPHLDSDYALVQGFRDKVIYAQEDETPLRTYAVIRLLSGIESVVTGHPYKEWHSGFVMYSTDFLRRVPFDRLSGTRHIDGEILICAGVLKARTCAVPIYKRYKEHVPLGGMALLKHVWDTGVIMFRGRAGKYRGLMAEPARNTPPCGFTVLARSG